MVGMMRGWWGPQWDDGDQELVKGIKRVQKQPGDTRLWKETRAMWDFRQPLLAPEVTAMG